MSNTQYNPRPQGQPGQQGQPQYTAQPQPAAQKPEASFFRWIRESRVERTNDRVIAGVCGAIARELGWNVTLVRVLMVVAFFLGGFGAVLYGICWLLLPDELDHRILLEEVIDGHWDWSFVGVILCILIGGFSGFGFLWWGSWSVNMGACLFAALAFFLLVDNGRRRFAVRGAAQPGNPPTTPPANMPYGGAMPPQPAPGA
ncbi:PspC domain-containing protein, partial [Bifidobacterium choerinum]